MEDLLIRCADKGTNYAVLQDGILAPGTKLDGIIYTLGSTTASIEVVENKSRCMMHLTPSKAQSLIDWLTAWLDLAKINEEKAEEIWLDLAKINEEKAEEMLQARRDRRGEKSRL